MHDVAMSMLIVKCYEYCIWKHFSLLLREIRIMQMVDCCMLLFCNAQELIHVPIIHTRRRQWCLHYWYYYCSLVWGEYWYCLFFCILFSSDGWVAVASFIFNDLCCALIDRCADCLINGWLLYMYLVYTIYCISQLMNNCISHSSWFVCAYVLYWWLWY